MDQFRQIGEVVGSLKALMVLKHDIQINHKQCCFLLDMYIQAFDTISEEIKHNLRLNERNTKWKALEQPMKELHRIFKEGESYIKYCLDVKDWWGKAISLHMNKDCVEFHIHNLLCCFPVVIEAIETAAEISGFDEEEMQKRRAAVMKKYDRELIDPRFFQWMFGKQYLVTREICSRLESSWKEDRWLLLENIRQKKNAIAPDTLLKHEQRIAEFLLRKLDGVEQSNKILLPSSILVGSNDYHVKRRLGSWGGHVKEIQWLGENFALRNFFGDVEPLHSEISLVFSLSHPNILQYHCGFYDEERKEGYLVMELMNDTLATYIKEHSGQRKRLPFSTSAAVDIMLQIARGMEYMHARKIYHGELNPSHVLLKARNSSAESYFHAKIKGFGLTSIKSTYKTVNHSAADSIIWYAPEVLAENEKPGTKCTSKYTEKADVYSFGMICFQILTGKVPFDEGHLQGEKVVRNIRAGERPLFPYPSPKYLVNLTRRCWHTNPNLRPRFSSLCRILHYIKKVLVINPEHGQPETAPPLVDYCDIEGGYSKKFSEEESTCLTPVSQIPFQMFAYRLIEKEKISGKNWDSSNDGFSVHRRASILSDDGHLAAMDDLFLAPSDGRSVCSEIIDRKDSRLFDQRSAISEIPHRKLYLFDQASVGSESPDRRFSSVAADEKFFFADSPDRKVLSTPIVDRSPRIDTLEKKIISSMSKNQRLKFSDNQEKVMSPKAGDEKPTANVAAEQNLVSPRTTEKIKSAEQNLVSPRNLEKKISSDDQKLTSPESQEKKHASDDQKLTSPESQEKKHASDDQKLISSEAPEKKHSSDDRKLLHSKTPERMKSSTVNDKPLQGEHAQRRSVRTRKTNEKLSKIIEKKVLETNQISISSENTETTASKTRNQKITVKKDSSRGKLQDTKTSSLTEKLNDDSPRSSPARAKRIHSSPMSSPTRTPKASSRSSPAIATKGYAYQSPSSSPLNPCSRCARVNRECQPSGMSPHIQRKAHPSHSEIA
ncbi:uncharacterized protein [Nicotiana tomentosiformis]|uniref:uncharacterized protein n=1 Tax=Nicotiana tomentosiformis TaxID=4098 RepID=UPI00388C4754